MEGERFLADIKAQIRAKLEPIMKNVQITSRVKSVHGIFRKVYIKGKDFEQIFDIYAVRIIVDSMIDCYNALGIVHDMFTPLPGRFKDYISTPSPICTSLCTPLCLAPAAFPLKFRFAPGICTARQSTVSLPTGSISWAKAAGLHRQSVGVDP